MLCLCCFCIIACVCCLCVIRLVDSHRKRSRTLILLLVLLLIILLLIIWQNVSDLSWITYHNVGVCFDLRCKVKAKYLFYKAKCNLCLHLWHYFDINQESAVNLRYQQSFFHILMPSLFLTVVGLMSQTPQPSWAFRRRAQSGNDVRLWRGTEQGKTPFSLLGNSRHLTELSPVFSTHSRSYPPLPLACFLHSFSPVFSTHSHPYSPLPLARILLFAPFVISSSSRSSSPLCHTRHLQALLLVISWEKTTDPTKGRFLIVFYEYG